MPIKNITVFRVRDFHGGTTGTFLDELRVRLHPFLPIDDMPEAQGLGWTGYTDLLDTQFSECSVQIGNYLVFALRLDKRNIPAAVLKKHYSQLLKKEELQIREQGKKFVSRERKKELREQVKFQLLRKAEPVPAHYPVIVNKETGLVYFGCNSAGIIAEFMKLFANTFQPLQLEQLDPSALCGNEYLDAGRKFLTRVFKDGLKSEGNISLYFTDKVSIVDGVSELSGVNLLSEELDEIHAGLDAGKEVVRLAMCVEDNAASMWRFTLSQNLQISALRLPFIANDSGDDPDAPILEEIYLIERLTDILFAACKEVAGQQNNPQEKVWRQRLMPLKNPSPLSSPTGPRSRRKSTAGKPQRRVCARNPWNWKSC